MVSMDSSHIDYGVLVKCLFPYVGSPSRPGPGPRPHYCVALAPVLPFKGRKFVVVAYGTSKFDDDLLEEHQGAILRVSSGFIKGEKLPRDIGYFVMDPVAVIPYEEEWVMPFSARLDFVTREQGQKSAAHQRLYENLVFMRHFSNQAATRAVNRLIQNGAIGLIGAAKLR